MSVSHWPFGQYSTSVTIRSAFMILRRTRGHALRWMPPQSAHSWPDWTISLA